MATVNRPSDTLNKLNYYLNHCPHKDWDHFSQDEQAQMIEEDLFAGRSVSIVLTSVITIGMLLSAATLAYVVLTT